MEDADLNVDLKNLKESEALSYTENEIMGLGNSAIVRRLKEDSSYVGKFARTIGDDQKALDREIKINQELVQAGLFDHPNLCVAVGVATIENYKSMVMKIVSGPKLSDHVRELRNHIRQGAYPNKEILREIQKLAREIASGLQALHAKQFVMNDLHDGNIKTRVILGNSVQPVILDFGCAGKTEDYVKPGKLEITPPERIRARDEHTESDEYNAPLSPKTDAYSFGALLFYMIHLRYPSWIKFTNASEGRHRQDDASDAHHSQEDMRRMEMESGIEKFSKNQTIFPEASPHREDLGAGTSEEMSRETAFRDALVAAGFYDLINKLMHPDPGLRLSVADALATHPFLKNESGKRQRDGTQDFGSSDQETPRKRSMLRRTVTG